MRSFRRRRSSRGGLAAPLGEGAVVTRDELLERVWGQRHTGGNVVDAVVRLLRKKLGPYASALATVKGHGYRLEPPRSNP